MNRKRSLDRSQENQQEEVPRRRLEEVAPGIVKETIDDSLLRPNIMKWTKEERLKYISTQQNPFGYPKKYLDIYERERQIKNPRGFEHLLNIDNLKLNPNDKVTQTKNINCIKSTEKNLELMNLDGIIFGKEICEKFPHQYYNSLEEFKEYSGYTDIEDEKYDELMRKYTAQYGINYLSNNKINEIYYEDVNDIERNITNEYKQKYDQYMRNFPNKYRIIIHWIKYCLGDLAQYVCIAGGFVLSMYIYEKHGYPINFSDIDLFIHSCDENTIRLIIDRLEYITRGSVNVYENVILSFFPAEYSDTPSKKIDEFGQLVDIKEYNKSNFRHERILRFENEESNHIKMAVQIIRRLYTSPAQVILGFDVDCCSILSTLDGNVYATERCAYAIQNGYNVVNFERMSPSYEYRIMKYNERGFGAWIPFVQHFKDNCLLNSNFKEKGVQSHILLKKMIARKFNFIEKLDKSITEVSDYYRYRQKTYEYTGANKHKNITFKTLNPSEQIINTFHRIVLDDPLEWYPHLPESNQIIRKVVVNNDDDKNMIHVTDDIIQQISPPGYYLAMNIISSRQNYAYSRGLSVCNRQLIAYLDLLFPRTIVTGNFAMKAMVGIPILNSKYQKTKNIVNDILLHKKTSRIVISNPNITGLSIIALSYRLTVYALLLKIRSAFNIPEDVDPLTLGNICFSNDNNKIDIKNSYKLFVELCQRGNSFYLNYKTLNRNRQHSTGLFLPSPDFLSWIENRWIPSETFFKKVYYDYELPYSSISEEKMRLLVRDRMENFIVFIIMNLRQTFPISVLNIPSDPISEFYESAIYQDGKYWSTMYDLHLAKLGFTHSDIGKKVFIFEEDACQQFFV